MSVDQIDEVLDFVEPLCQNCTHTGGMDVIDPLVKIDIVLRVHSYLRFIRHELFIK